jgi:hypothetical protein
MKSLIKFLLISLSSKEGLGDATEISSDVLQFVTQEHKKRDGKSMFVVVNSPFLAELAHQDPSYLDKWFGPIKGVLGSDFSVGMSLIGGGKEALANCLEEIRRGQENQSANLLNPQDVPDGPLTMLLFKIRSIHQTHRGGWREIGSFIPCIIFFLLPLLSAIAQDRPIDYQFRFLMHLQTVEPGKTFGVAAWGIIPDATQKISKYFLVTGLVARGDTTKWVEIMGGGYISYAKSGGDFFLAADVRSSINLRYGVNSFAEILYSFQERKLTFLPNITENIRVGNFKIGFGGESDVIFERGKKPSYGFGPRIAISWPWHPSKISLVTGYQETNGDFDVLRSYLLLNF